MWRKGNFYALLVRMYIAVDTIEKTDGFSKVENRTTI